MIYRNKLWVLISISASILAILVLAAGLKQVELSSGTFSDPGTQDELLSLVSQFGRYRNLFLVFILIGFVYVMMHLRRSRQQLPPAPANRKQRPLLITLLQIIMWVIALLVFRKRISESQFEILEPPAAPGPDILTQNIIPEVSTNIPDWLSFFFSILLVSLVVLVVWWIWRKRKLPSDYIMGQIVQDAQLALEDLQSGSDLRNVIIRCYYDMVQALHSQRGIRRSGDMTPREFESRLVALGLPSEPVQQLTRLFESVRYGDKASTKATENQAIDCLKTIIAASMETA